MHCAGQLPSEGAADVGAPGQTRTDTVRDLNPLPLPIGIRGQAPWAGRVNLRRPSADLWQPAATTMSVASSNVDSRHIHHAMYVACGSHCAVSLMAGPMADPRPPAWLGRWPMTAPRRVLIAEDEAL